MKKVLCGLVIALMMTGSGYAVDMERFGDYTLKATNAPKSECIKALKKGKRIDFPSYNIHIFYVYDDKLYGLSAWDKNHMWCETFS